MRVGIQNQRKNKWKTRNKTLTNIEGQGGIGQKPNDLLFVCFCFHFVPHSFSGFDYNTTLKRTKSGIARKEKKMVHFGCKSI